VNAFFGWLVGTWAGVRREAATGEERPMVVIVKSVLGGTGILEEIEVDLGHDRKYHGLCLSVEEEDGWLMRYFNSARRPPALLRFEDGAWVSEHSRLVYERVGEDGWRRSQYRDGLLFEDELKRS
jgi:hypothetical protein